MSATNSTPIINLPLFIGTDKPAWLTDWNGAMNTIDSAIAALQTAEAGTATSLASLAQSVEALSSTVSQHTTAIQTVTTATATNTGSINTITSLIGNGEPTTTDKTLIGAINELHTDIETIAPSGDLEADGVAYDNTDSGLTATNVQAAIDELASSSGGASVHIDVTATETWAQVLARLTAAVDISKLTAKSALKYINNICPINYNDGSIAGFILSTITSGLASSFWQFYIGTSNVARNWTAGSTGADKSSEAVGSAFRMEVFY